MTLQDLINLMGDNPKTILAYYLVVLAITIIAAMYVNRENFKSPVTYIYSVLIYAVSMPGIIALILIIYGFFFKKVDFLNVNLLAYFLPIIALIVVFVILSRTVSLKQIPGFKNIVGLFMMIAGAFFIAFILQRMFIGVIFFGRVQTLLMIFVVMFVAIKIGWDRMVKK